MELLLGLLIEVVLPLLLEVFAELALHGVVRFVRTEPGIGQSASKLLRTDFFLRSQWPCSGYYWPSK
jgi:hypothetical protein